MNKQHWLILVLMLGLMIEWHAHYAKGEESIWTAIFLVAIIIIYQII